MPQADNEMLIAVKWPRTHGHGIYQPDITGKFKAKAWYFSPRAQRDLSTQRGEISVLLDEKERALQYKNKHRI